MSLLGGDELWTSDDLEASRGAERKASQACPRPGYASGWAKSNETFAVGDALRFAKILCKEGTILYVAAVDGSSAEGNVGTFGAEMHGYVPYPCTFAPEAYKSGTNLYETTLDDRLVRGKTVSFGLIDVDWTLILYVLMAISYALVPASLA